MKLRNANAEYTGGGIYVYWGQLEDGKYFFTGDYEETMMMTDLNPEEYWDDIFYPEWQEEHCSEVELTTAFKNEVLTWIANNEPYGNYSVNELEARKEV